MQKLIQKLMKFKNFIFKQVDGHVVQWQNATLT